MKRKVITAGLAVAGLALTVTVSHLVIHKMRNKA